MSITLFKTLIAVSDTGSFRAAADDICVTHAAVGQQMKRLESSLGVVLFDRSEKTPRLNQLGKAFVPKAQAIVHAYDTILDDLTGEPDMIGELILGAIPSTIRGLIPKSAKGLIRLYPNLNIRVLPDISPNLLSQVASGQLDVAVMSKPIELQANLNWMPFYDEELVLLTAPEVESSDALSILSSMPYIRHSKHSAVGILADDWLKKQKIKVQDSMEMASLENLASMISHNLGVSVAPNICVPDPIFNQLKKISLGASAPTRSLGVLTRMDCSKLRLINKYYEQINKTVARYSASALT